MLIALQTYGVFAQNEEDSVVVPFGGNAWSSSLALHTVYFRLKHTGRIRITTGQYNISTFLIKDTGYQTLQLTGPAVQSITLKGAGVQDAIGVVAKQVFATESVEPRDLLEQTLGLFLRATPRP